MPDTDISSMTSTDLSSTVTDYAVSSESTDANESKETRHYMTHWNEDLGYYLNIPEFAAAVDKIALWTLGAGYESDEFTQILLDSIKGNGKDSFNSILKNMIKAKTIGGDSFCEIIRNDDDVIINLKPLDPASVVIVTDLKGMIIRYEQVSKFKGNPNKTFKPTDIFHLSHDRIADSVFGRRVLKSLKYIIEARNEAMQDWRTVLHRNVKPMRIWYVDTDDTAEISTFQSTVDSANENTENIVVPKGTVETEIASVSPNQTMNPLPWIESLGDYFFQAVMTPQILYGNAKGFTDASGKIVYLAYEQSVKDLQLYIEEQVLSQLNVEITLNFPASLQQDLISGQEKGGHLQAAEPNDQMVEMEGRK